MNAITLVKMQYKNLILLMLFFKNNVNIIKPILNGNTKT